MIWNNLKTPWILTSKPDETAPSGGRQGKDIHVILQICSKHGLTQPAGFVSKKEFEQKFAIKNKTGKELGKNEVLDFVDETAKSAGVETFAIVLDADQSASSTWQAVCSALQKAGYTDLPAEISKDGVLIVDTDLDLPKVGIWIMPDNESPGEIEDFFLQLIHEEDIYLPRAKEVVGELITDAKYPLVEGDRSKAEVHTWLAWQKEPGRSMGVAIKSNWTVHHHASAERFVQWFSKVFELEQ